MRRMGLAIRRERIFVGRQREMGELRDALDEAMADQGRSVMLTGEPGIGKTRTAQELGSAAVRATVPSWPGPAATMPFPSSVSR